MKLLFFTDSHVRATNPRSRLDDYYATSIKKFEEIRDYANNNNVDFVIHGGDLFDRPDTAIKPTSEIAKVLGGFIPPIYIVSGNHDIFGYNVDTLGRSMLGLLDAVGTLNMIPEDGIVLQKEDVSVLLLGVPYSSYLDTDKANYIVKKAELKYEADYVINVVHGFLAERKFHEIVPHILINEILDTEADITLTGHFHSGFKTRWHEGKVFANPGSLLRMSNSTVEMSRKPKFLEIIIDKGGFVLNDIYLKSALPGDEVLDKTVKEESQFKRQNLLDFRSNVEQNIDLARLDVESIMNKIATSENFDKQIRDEAKRRIDIAKEDYDDINH